MERVVSRLPGPALGQEPPRKFAAGRKRVRHARDLHTVRAELDYGPCPKGSRCKNDCSFLAPNDRSILYAEYKLIRADVRAHTQTLSFTIHVTLTLTHHSSLTPCSQVHKGAKYRAYAYLSQFMKRVKRIRRVRKLVTLSILFEFQMLEPLHLQLCNIVPIVSVIPGNCGIPRTTIHMIFAYVVANYNTAHTS